MRYSRRCLPVVLTVLFAVGDLTASAVPKAADEKEEIRLDCTAVEDDVFIYVPAREAWERDDEITFLDYPGWLSVLGDTIFGIPPEARDGASFKMEYRDGSRLTVYRVHIAIQAVNDPPVITSEAEDVATQGQYYHYHLKAEDPDNTDLVYTFEDIPEWAMAADGIVSGTPPVGEESGTFTAVVSDGEHTVRQQVHLDILPGDDDDGDEVFERLISGRFGFVIYPSPLDHEEKMMYFGFVWQGTSIRYSLSIFDMDGNKVHRIEEDVWNPDRIVRTQALDMGQADLAPGKYVAELRVLDKEKGQTLKSRRVITISG